MRSKLRPGTPTAALLVLTLLVAGCSGFRAANQPLDRFDPRYGYQPSRLAERRPVGDVLLLLAFSGGGTRAASFAYGVLQELRDTSVVVDGERRRLLDEVDVITSVSGGSFTSAYYGLFGDRIFEDFEERFLRRNVQRALLLELLRPPNWFRLARTFFDRTDLAIELYDREIFDRATFADLLEAEGPLLQINATDLAAGQHFTFLQPKFDPICSDLSDLEVARAVAASSAVPILFNAITLRNYAGTCGYQPPDWLVEGLDKRHVSRRRYFNAKIALSYLDAEERPYIHLVDGGIADNVGLREPLDNVTLGGGLFARLATLGVSIPRHIVVVVVDSEVNPEPHFSRNPAAPSLQSVIGSVTGVQINRYTFETIALMDESLREWARELPPLPDGSRVKTHMVEVAFDYLEDPERRAYFNDLPTSFRLDDEAVDRLIATSRELMRDSEAYRELVADLDGSLAGPGPAPLAGTEPAEAEGDGP